MTRDEAIAFFKDMQECTYDNCEAVDMAIKSLEKQEDFIKILFEIQEAVWGMDIPSPTVPEYVEHHNQMQELLALIDTKIKEIEA